MNLALSPRTSREADCLGARAPPSGKSTEGQAPGWRPPAAFVASPPGPDPEQPPGRGVCGPGLSPSALATGPHQRRAQPVDTAELTAGPGPHRDPEWSLPSPGSCTWPGWGAWGPGGQAAIPTPIRANFQPSWEGADSPPEEPWPQGSHRTAHHPPPGPPETPPHPRSTSGPDFRAVPTNLTAAQTTVLPPARLLPGPSTPGRGRSVSHVCEGWSPRQQAEGAPLATLNLRGRSGDSPAHGFRPAGHPAWSSHNGTGLTLTMRPSAPLPELGLTLSPHPGCRKAGVPGQTGAGVSGGWAWTGAQSRAWV